MERAGGQRISWPKIWQIPAFSRNQPSCGTPQKIASEKRRLSLRSENKTVTGTAKCASTATPQSSSSTFKHASTLAQKPPGKENESPTVLQEHGGKFRAGIITKSTIKRKKSSNSGYITNSEKKVVKRRLSGDYEEKLSSKKLFQPIIAFSSKVRRTKADVNNGRDATNTFPVYNDLAERSTDGSFGTSQVSESIKRVEGATAKSESRGAGTPRCGILENDPSTAPLDLYSLWKSYNSRYRSHEADRTATPISESAEEKVKPGESSARQDADQEVSGVEFLIEKVDRNDGRASAINNCRRVKSGSDIGRLNVTLKRGEDVSPLKRRIIQLKKSASTVWQIPAFSRCQPSCGTTSKFGCEGRRLSLRSENRTVTGTAECTSTATLQSSSSSSGQVSLLSQKLPGKENESPIGVQDHGGKVSAGIPTKSTIKHKKSSNPGNITNFEKKVVKRRLSGDYEEQLSSKKLFQPIIAFPSKVRPTEADVNNDQDATNTFPVYDLAEKSTDDSFGISQVSESNERVEGTMAKSESRGAGTPRCEILEKDPFTAPLALYSHMWKSYNSRYRSHEAGRTATPISESAEEKAKPGESSVKQDADQEVSGVEFLIEKVDPNDGRASAMNNFRRIKSGSDIGRLNVTLKRGEDVSPLKRRIIQLKKSASMVRKSFRVEKDTRKRQPAVVTTKDGFRRITYGEEAVRTSFTALCHQRANHPFPAKESKNVRSSRNYLCSDQDPRAIKSAVAISGLLNETPFEIQYTTDYTKESIDLEHAREEHSYKISHTFLKEKSVTPEQRRIVVNFLISVHAYLLTSSSTLHQATKIFDAILDIKDVSVKELQLVALGASWIAIKNMETKVPTAGEMISFAKDMYNTEGPKLLCKCERKILKTLGFNIRFPDPFYVSDYYLQQWSSSGTLQPNNASVLRTIRRSVGYLIDVALLHESYSSLPSELLAAAAVQTAVHVVLNTSWDELSENSTWNKEKLTRCTQEEIDRVAGPLIESVLKSAEKGSPIGAVYKKYKNPKCDNTSDYLVTKIKNKLAN